MIIWYIVAIVLLVTCSCHSSNQIQTTESLDLSRINTSALSWSLYDTIFGHQLIPALNGLPISTDATGSNTGIKPAMIDNGNSYPIYPTLIRHTTIKATGSDTTTMQQKQTSQQNQQRQQTHETQRSWLDIIARLIIAFIICFLILHILIKK